MKRSAAIILVLLSWTVDGQKTKFWIYPDLGYTYQKIHNWSFGLHLGLAKKDSSGYLQNTWAFLMRAENVWYQKTCYVSPSFGFYGYRYLFGAHHGLCGEITVSRYHALQKKDWLLTPEIGFAWGGLIHLMIGYSIQLDQPELDFYSGLRLSCRLTI